METSTVKIAKLVDRALMIHLAQMTIAGQRETKMEFLNKAVVDRINRTGPKPRKRKAGR